jgi:hypothetical protein
MENINLEKFKFYDKNILDKLYEETPIQVMTAEEFNNLPLNDKYKETKEKENNKKSKE